METSATRSYGGKFGSDASHVSRSVAPKDDGVAVARQVSHHVKVPVGRVGVGTVDMYTTHRDLSARRHTVVCMLKL